jgi:hypothetical protein
LELAPAAALFRSLGDPSRLAIVRRLAGAPARVADLVAGLGLAGWASLNTEARPTDSHSTNPQSRRHERCFDTVDCIVAAIVAGSVALLGFGLDSAIEGLASVIVIWRFTGARTLSPTGEQRGPKALPVTFFLLAPYIAYDAVTTLIAQDRPQTSWLGIALAITSPIVCRCWGRRKSAWTCA